MDVIGHLPRANMQGGGLILKGNSHVVSYPGLLC